MDEEERLEEVMDLTEGNKILDKKTAEEAKKLEKIVKKEQNEFEDLTGTGASNTKIVYDKLIRTLRASRQVTKEANKQAKEYADITIGISDNKENIKKNVKTKNMLQMICDTFLNSNFDLY
jgi:superfamily II helicase